MGVFDGCLNLSQTGKFAVCI